MWNHHMKLIHYFNLIMVFTMQIPQFKCYQRMVLNFNLLLYFYNNLNLNFLRLLDNWLLN